ncbi:MAG: hypothetical protein J7J87_04625 [Candidatus Diapherotrites archaeon]|nr:hypothetical protein [Candidatus Diapherotrites archaeon]
MSMRACRLLCKRATGDNNTNNRDWKSINNRLIRQGTLLLSISFLEKWDEQLSGMNNNKVGRPSVSIPIFT